MEELTIHAKERAPQATPASRRPRAVTVIIIIGALVAGVVAVILGSWTDSKGNAMNDKARLRAQAEAIFKPKQQTAAVGGQPVKDHEAKAAAATAHMHRQRAERLEREARATSRPIPKGSKRAKQRSLAE